MELAHGLLLNEEALKTIPPNKKDIFVYEWLRFLHKVLKASQKSDIKEKQKQLVEQLSAQILAGPGPPTRSLIGHCLSTLYQVGDSYTIYEIVGKCNEIVKNKDDSPSYLSIRLAAIVAIGILYENNGRMLGGLFPETVQVLVKGLKNAESQTRSETMNALRCVLVGLGTSATMCHRDIYKSAKAFLLDRSMFVRTSAAQCLEELIKESNFVFMNEFEPLIQQAIRALDGSTYEVRCAVARMIGCLVAGIPRLKSSATKGKKPTIDDAMTLLANGFLQAGSTGGARDLLKGNSGGSSIRNIRIGITEAYVEIVRELGTEWLEKNLFMFLNKVLDIVAQPKVTRLDPHNKLTAFDIVLTSEDVDQCQKRLIGCLGEFTSLKASPNHVEAVYSRRCVSFILRSTVGVTLGESQQQAAVRELCRVITKHTAVADTAILEGNNSSNSATSLDVAMSQHVLVCATQEIGSLMRSLGTSATPLVAEKQSSIIDPVIGVLLFPSQSARLSAAWCLRCIAVALPSQLTPLIDRCAERMQSFKSSSEALLGYSAALSALLGAVKECPMGIPHLKGKMVFGIAEGLLRSVGQNSKLAICRTQGGWLLVGALMTMGPSLASHLLPKLLQMWKTSFPRSMRELEQEKQRGDAFTWQLTLEARSGALCAMRSFVAHCSELLTEETTRKIMVPLESAMAMMGILPDVIATHGAHLKASGAMVRLRLYDILALLPPGTYEGSFNALLRELVAEFTLTDNPAHTTTSLLHSLCHHDDSVLLESWIKETDQSLIEDQLQDSSGSGSLEHDPTSVYLQSPQENVAPGPLPLGVSVIDAAIALFGLAFPHVAMKHRLQMLKHFDDCAKQASKNVQRQRAIQTNVFTALICALKGLGESKRHLGGADVRGAATELIMGALTSTDPALRCAAGEAIGRMAQVGNDPTFVAKTAQLCFEKLKTARDVISRTGHSLALGCLHRYVGGMGSGQHLRMSVGILLALSQDSNSPEVQVWALHALSLLVDAFGPTFRSYVDSALHVVLTLFLQVAPHHVQVHRCLGRCLSALITTLGPELQGNATAISTARSSCLTSCAVMSHHIDAQVRSESVSCLQQLHMFAPRHVELISLIPRLCRYLSSWHLILRQSAVSCLRQLAQKEAAEVCTIAGKNVQPSSNVKRGVEIGETGLEGAIFSLLDREVNRKLISDARDTLSHILQAVALEKLGFWIPLCKSVLAASTDTASIKGVDTEQQEAGDETNDDDTFKIGTGKKAEKKNLIPPRWPTRVFAIELIRRIISMCRQSGSNPAHFDLAAARNIVRSGKKGEFLVLHLSDLVKMAFMASTDNSVPLRMAGLEALQDVIRYFKDVPEPEFCGSVILEQYQANVGAALRPAFSAVDASHEVTVRACEVCSAWIGSGVVSDLSDLKRVHALLVSSLGKVTEANSQDSRNSKHVYSESAATMEKLAILKAWAEVYISSVEKGEDKKSKGSLEGSLLSLVEPQLKVLADFWLKALKDQAILKLPPEVASHLQSQSGAFFTAESVTSVRPHYDYAWPKIVHALSLWLSLVGFSEESIEEKERELKEKQRENNLHLVMGVCVEALCSPRTSESIGVTVSCLSSLDALLSSRWARTKLGNDQVLGIEILNVLHRLLLTRDSYSSQKIVLSVVKKVLRAAKEHLFGGGGEFTEVQDSGEGGESGEFVTGQSTVFAVLEVCMCVLVRHIPSINPTFRSVNQEQVVTNKKLSPEGAELVVIAINLLSDVLCLCSARGSLTILPTVLFLLVGILREGMSRSGDLKTSSVVVTTTALQSLRAVLTSPFVKENTYRKEWIQLLQSGLASVLEFTKEEVSTFDCTSLLTCISLFLLQAPTGVCASPKLLVQILDYFEKCLTTGDSKTQVKCLAFLSPVFRHSERLLSFSFIHRMAPLIVQRLAEIKRDCTTDEVSVATECFNLLELLVTLTENEHRDDMIQMLVPILMSRLSEHPEKVDLNGNSSSAELLLHNDALQRLMQIGPKYPVGFKAAVASNPRYKATLEKALRQNQAQVERTAQQRAAHLSALQKTNAQPSIKLKMDFSNFGKK